MTTNYEEVVGITVDAQDFKEIFGHDPSEEEWDEFLALIDDALYRACGGYTKVLAEVAQKK